MLPGRKLLLIGGEGHYKDNDKLKYPKHTNEVPFLNMQFELLHGFLKRIRLSPNLEAYGN